MSIAAYDSPSIQPMNPVFLPPIGLAGTLLPNLDSPSKSGRNGVGDHLEEEPDLDGFKPSPLQPNKRRKTTQSSSAISGEFPLSSDFQASSSFKHPHTFGSASFTGGGVPHSESPRDGAPSPKHADHSFSNAEPPKLPRIISLANHGAAPSFLMPISQHAAYTPKAPADARQDQRTIHSQSLLGESDSSEKSRQHQSRSLESASTSTSLSPDPSASRPEPNAHPIGGRPTRASTQLMTQRSKYWAEHSQLGAKGLTMYYGVPSAFLQPVEGSIAPAYRASADELELWTDANVSPVVFGKHKFARRLSEEQFKGAVTFNLRHLLPGMGDLRDAPRPEKRRSLAATSERSRKSHIAFIVQDALGLEEQTPLEETDDGFSTDDIATELRDSPDTPADVTDTDDHDSKVSVRPDHNSNLKPTLYNTHFLSFQRERRSFLPPNRHTPSSKLNIQKNIIRKYIPPNSLPKTFSTSTPDNIQATKSSTPYSNDSFHSSTPSLRLPEPEHSGHSPKELSREPFQTPRGTLLAAKESAVEVTEIISPVITVEDPNTARSPSAQSSSPSVHGDTTFTNSQRLHEGSQRLPLPHDGSTPSSLFGTTNSPETTVGSLPPSEVFPPQAIHDVPVPTPPSSKLDSDKYSDGLPATRHGKFFHECSIQSSEDTSFTNAMARGIVFRPSTGSSNSRFRDVTTWPSPAAPEDHPYLQEARGLMVIVKSREDLLPHFGEAAEVDTEEDREIEIEGESEIDEEDELDGSEDSDAIESNGTHDELDTLTAFPSTPAAAGRHDMSLPGWVSYNMTPSRRAHGLDHRAEGEESISTDGDRGTNAEQQVMLVPPAATSSAGDHDSDHAGDENDQINHEDQLEDWTASLQTLVKGKRVLLAEELLNLKTVLNAVHTHSPTISASSELAQTVLQVAKLETRDIPNQDSLGLRSLARKSLRAWGLSARTKT